MKIKQVAPWNLKPGQLLLQNNGQFDRFNKIISIKKEIGRFTGKALWRIKTDAEFFSDSTFHAKLNYLKLQKATIKID